MDSDGRTQRSFLGLALPTATQQRLEQEARSLQQLVAADHFRWVAPRNYHLTLAFLGALSWDRLNHLQALLAGQPWLPRALELEVTDLGGFPSVSRSRYLVGFVQPQPGLEQLYQQLQERLAAANYPTESRPLHPHITLARGTQRQARERVDRQHITPSIRFNVEELVLFASHARPSGSEYERIAGFR